MTTRQKLAILALSFLSIAVPVQAMPGQEEAPNTEIVLSEQTEQQTSDQYTADLQMVSTSTEAVENISDAQSIVLFPANSTVIENSDNEQKESSASQPVPHMSKTKKAMLVTTIALTGAYAYALVQYAPDILEYEEDLRGLLPDRLLYTLIRECYFSYGGWATPFCLED
jgi:hypothetical protein